MSFFNKYPYLDEHELNLDWLIAKMRSLEIKFDEFKVVNNITFSGEWDITKQYPAWTIVSDNNIGYVSLQPVPAGITLSNGDYWVEVIDYTAQIAGLQSRVVALENDVADIQDDLSPLINRKFLFVGDSFGEVANGWIDTIITMMVLTPSDYYRYAEGGIGFVNPGNNTGVAIESALSTYIGTLTQDEIDSITDIIVVMGENDTQAAHISSLSAAVESFCVYLYGTFKNLQKAKFFYNGTYNIPTNATYGARGLYKHDGRGLMMRAVNQYPKMSYSDNVLLSLLNAGLTEADGVHPTYPLGYQMMTRAIMAGYEGEDFIYLYKNTIDNFVFVTGNYLTDIDISYNTTIYDSTALSFTAEGLTTIVPNASLPIYPKQGKIWSIPLPAAIGNDNIVRTNLTLVIRDNGNIQIFNPGTAFTLTTLRVLMPIHFQLPAID